MALASSSRARVLLHRSAARRSQRGAAVFIVVMAIVLLTGIGVFAVRTASLVDVAAGYDRQAMQTHRLSELAGRTLASDVAGSGDVLGPGMDRSLAVDRCIANFNPTTSVTQQNVGCVKKEQFALEQHIAKSYPDQTSLLMPATADEDGSLGPQLGAADTLSTPLERRVEIEITDLNEVEQIGGSSSGYYEFTVTAHAQIRANAVANQPWCAGQAESMGASVQMLRAHIRVPKPPKPANQP